MVHYNENDNWVTIVGSPGADVHMETLGGVALKDLPLPPRVHFCRPSMRGWTGLNQTFGCGCGARAFMPSIYGWHWTGKNSRRK